MKNIIMAAFAIVFSASVLFSSGAQKIEHNFLSNEATKCRMATFEEAERESDAIFVGEVLSAEKSGDDKVFTFKIEKYWKGKDAKNAHVSVYESARFQAWFKTGEKYLVYAKADDDGTLRDSARCSRSKDLENASEDLTKLGEGKSPK
jgi:hypothetical protein